jgi:hypothetical protein
MELLKRVGLSSKRIDNDPYIWSHVWSKIILERGQWPLFSEKKDGVSCSFFLHELEDGQVSADNVLYAGERRTLFND